MVLLIRRKEVWPMSNPLNLHSTMVLLIRYMPQTMWLIRYYLHSTMVLLIRDLSTKANAFATHLHSTMVLLIHSKPDRVHIWSIIYIPLWFYLYCATSFCSRHSITIYIPLWFYLYKVAPIKSFLNSIFTFHYGSTYTVIPVGYVLPPSDLHSTMVLLILSEVLIEKRVYVSFTFHYGSTYTKCLRNPFLVLNKIYIPLWFYLYFVKPQ